MGYLETLALNKFDGDVDKARAWLSDNGKKGGKTGVKYFQKVSKRTLRRISRQGQAEMVNRREHKREERRLRRKPLDERVMQTYLED